LSIIGRGLLKAQIESIASALKDSPTKSLDDNQAVMERSDLGDGRASFALNPLHVSHVSAIEVVDEYVDRERRKVNLIVHNLPESDATKLSDRVAHDISTFESIVAKDLKIEEARVTNAVRLGKVTQGHPRVLLLTMCSEHIKWKILNQATKLCDSSTWKKVYISPDLTAKEREVNRKLCDELKRRKEAGEMNLMIKRGKIIERPISVPRQEQVATAGFQLTTHLSKK